MRTAVDTSLAIITATSSIGLAVHLVAGRGIDLAVTSSMTAACVAGALVGATLATHGPRRALGHRFALLLSGGRGLHTHSAAFLGGPPSS